VGDVGITPSLGTIGGFGSDRDEADRVPESLGSTESE